MLFARQTEASGTSEIYNIFKLAAGKAKLEQGRNGGNYKGHPSP